MENSIKDVIDLAAWKKAQESLSAAISLPISTIDREGSEIILTGPSSHYTQILKTTDYGKEMMKDNFSKVFTKLSKAGDKILLYYSDDGLLNVWAPIMVENKCIGAMGCTSLLETKNIPDFSKILEKTNIDSDELKESLKLIKPLSSEDVKMYGSMLYIMAKTLPDILRQKTEKDKKIKELTSIYNITKIINSTLKLEIILGHVMNFLMESLKVRNCSITILDDNKKSYYYSKFDKSGLIERIVTDDILHTKNIVRINNVMADFRLKNDDLKLDFDSVMAFPLMIKNEVVGIINLYFGFGAIKGSDTEFVSIVADQVSMAILNAQELQTAKESAVTDKLTDLFNRGYFVDLLKQDLIKNIETEKPLSVALLDIDDFKVYNDTHGHVKGDELIREVSDILKNNVRGIDVVGRYGGEEFIIIFPGLKNETAHNIMEIIRRRIENSDFFGINSMPTGKVTVSTGLVTCMDKLISYDDLIEHADKTLYKSKTRGKNLISSSVVVNKNLPEVDVEAASGFGKNGY